MVAQDIIAVAVETENRSKSKLLSSIFGVEKVAGALISMLAGISENRQGILLQTRYAQNDLEMQHSHLR
jgi:hypothetical protein